MDPSIHQFSMASIHGGMRLFIDVFFFPNAASLPLCVLRPLMDALTAFLAGALGVSSTCACFEGA